MNLLIEQNFNGWILAAIITAIIYGIFYLQKPVCLARSIFKTLPVFLLALGAFFADAPIMLVIALLFCAAGDLFLSKQGEPAFLAGLGAFLLGHLAYIYLFYERVNLSAEISIFVIINFVLVGSALVFVMFRLWPYLGALKPYIILYGSVITLMAIIASASDCGMVIFSGVILFVVSDIMLAYEKFLPDINANARKLLSYLVWLFYFTGQLLITTGWLNLMSN